ncbi:hypothetical protein GOTRE_076_00600 [Gordonia terrae NBRC 100016]|uniref:HTH merR-type domain-containing protein n=1 Tax=Gordonia terrae NBRC 100016 TaxID=1089454 RepID=A0ABQ0HGF7_9ACTN|nr:hypothetical protein GOTRE_076_00600 [Gordonia terrae NBRC 100016]
MLGVASRYVSTTGGDFGRATRLSAKALRFYHRVGLLEPARIDAATQYRYYAPEQIDDARVIHPSGHSTCRSRRCAVR